MKTYKTVEIIEEDKVLCDRCGTELFENSYGDPYYDFSFHSGLLLTPNYTKTEYELCKDCFNHIKNIVENEFKK